MKKKAHVAAGPEPAVGDEALALCGKVFTVEVLWGDVPKKHPICRDCVEVALQAAAEGDRVIRAVRTDASLLLRIVGRMSKTLYPEDMDLTMDMITEQRADWLTEQDEAKEAAEAEQAAAETCTCRWVDGVRVDNPVCRIHGADDEEANDSDGPRGIEDTPEVP